MLSECCWTLCFIGDNSSHIYPLTFKTSSNIEWYHNIIYPSHLPVKVWATEQDILRIQGHYETGTMKWILLLLPVGMMVQKFFSNEDSNIIVLTTSLIWLFKVLCQRGIIHLSFSAYLQLKIDTSVIWPYFEVFQSSTIEMTLGEQGFPEPYTSC